METTVCFTGGGTGGHIYPGLAVMDTLVNRLSEQNARLNIYWIGSGKDVEKEIVPAHGVQFYPIPAGKLRRYFSFRNFFDLFKIAAGFVKSLFILMRHRPAVVFSKGGFVSVPPVAAAALLRIPVITHDSDLDPGLATKINSLFARKICVPYKQSTAYFSQKKRENVVVTGNPVRPAVFAGDPSRGREILGIDDKKPLILVLGGSQGALQVNNLIASVLDQLLAHAYIVHQSGPGNELPEEKENYLPLRYIKEELPHFLAAADIVLGRAGANTIWEAGVHRKPLILIPLTTGSSRGDQLRNASLFEEAGAAAVFTGDIDKQLFADKVIELIKDKSKRENMGKASGTIAGRDGSRLIADLIIEFLEEGHADPAA